MKIGRWWHREADRFVCDLCPRGCRLRPGQRGFCFVREANDDGIVLSTYGYSSGLCVDPIEKKPLFHFYPGSSVLSFGTAGCNLACRFCQNWHISKARRADRLVGKADPEAIASAALRQRCRSVAFTYNDPVIFAEYAIDTALECRRKGVRSVAVTAGYIEPAARSDLFSLIDAANVDLKAFTERFYRRLCRGHLDPVLETLLYLVHETSVWVEITTLLIPGENDSEDELRTLSRWIRDELSPDIPLHFSAYRPAFELRNPATPEATVKGARRIALAEGLRFVYTGNIQDRDGQRTLCAACGETLVERAGHRVEKLAIASGKCKRCGTVAPGRFAGPA